MVKPFNNMDEFTKKWIKDGGLETPSPNFSKNVMNAVSSSQAVSIAYKPLISKRGWFIIFALLIGVAIALYTNPTEAISIFQKLKIDSNLGLENPFANIQFSEPMIYGIGFMALFLLQVPFLKKLLDSRYE